MKFLQSTFYFLAIIVLLIVLSPIWYPVWQVAYFGFMTGWKGHAPWEDQAINSRSLSPTPTPKPIRKTGTLETL